MLCSSLREERRKHCSGDWGEKKRFTASVYKNVLSDRRHDLTKENLSKIMICHCFYSCGE